jgi:hypothetical protein
MSIRLKRGGGGKEYGDGVRKMLKHVDGMLETNM